MSNTYATTSNITTERLETGLRTAGKTRNSELSHIRFQSRTTATKMAKIAKTHEGKLLLKPP